MSHNRAQFSTQAGCSSADQKRIGDNLDKHIADVAENFESLTVLIANRPLSSDEGRTVCETVNNNTRATSEELSRQANRQAVSAALQVAQFLLFAGYLLTLFVLYVVKKCKKHRKRQVEEEVELMEQKLQERKAKRRATATRAKGGPLPNQE